MLGGCTNTTTTQTAVAAAAGSAIDPGIAFVHVDIEMVGRMGTDAFRFCDYIFCCQLDENGRRTSCCCKKGTTQQHQQQQHQQQQQQHQQQRGRRRLDKPFGYSEASVGGIVHVSDSVLLEDAVRRVNNSYNCAIPLIFTIVPVTVMGTILPLVGVCCVIAGLVYGAASSTSVTGGVCLWVGVGAIGVGVVCVLLFCVISFVCVGPQEVSYLLTRLLVGGQT
eukprot:GHVS01055802.1.p1 GENE.GHVS01055802.1~~GHVS01055802.1.p1  ORF type:complete len:222 (-),score=68.13 GHVS01055802.1:10-675(-)